MHLRIVEDRPTPKEVYNRRIYGTATVICFVAIFYGYDGAFWGTTFARSSFQQAFGIAQMSADQVTAASANLTSVFQAGGFFGALSMWPIMELYGRKPVLLIGSIIYLAAATLMTALSSGIAGMYAARVLTGFGLGCCAASSTTYLAEIAPSPIRGQIVGLYEIFYQAGSVTGFWINYGISVNLDATSTASWRIPVAVQLIPAGMLFIGVWFIRESPAQLVRLGKDELALQNLAWIRNLPLDHHYLLEEMAFVKARMMDESTRDGNLKGVRGYLHGAGRELWTPHLRHRVILCFWLYMVQNNSGATAINYYSPTLFKALGITNVNLYTGIYGLVKAFGSLLFFAFIVDRSGRRAPWLVSTFLTACCLVYLVIYTKLGNIGSTNPSASDRAQGQAGVALIMLYAFFWSFGGNGLTWVVTSELFPSRLRSITGTMNAAFGYLTSTVAQFAFPHIIADGGAFASLLFCLLVMIITFVLVFVWVPETKGIPIECMETLFSGPARHAAWRQKRLYPPDGIPPVPDSLMIDGRMENALNGLEKQVPEFEEKEHGSGPMVASLA